MSDFEQYYIHRKGDFVGNAPMWWAKGGNGYTSYILGAERFSREDADALIRRSGEKYKAYLCADVDARLHLVYDVQDDKRLGTDAPCGWPWGYAAIASMHGEAVEWQFYESGKWFNFMDDNHRQNTIKAGYQVRPLFTYPPDASAEIARLTKELEEARKDVKRMDYLSNIDFTYRVLVQSQPSGDYVFDSCIVSGLRAAIDASLNIKGGAE